MNEWTTNGCMGKWVWMNELMNEWHEWHEWMSDMSALWIASLFEWLNAWNEWTWLIENVDQNMNERVHEWKNEWTNAWTHWIIKEWMKVVTAKKTLTQHPLLRVVLM